MCTDPLCIIPKGLAIAKAILLPDWTDSLIMWTEVIGRDHPQLRACHMQNVVITGLMDTGADVTVFSYSEWPPSWTLTSASGVWIGIGGKSDSFRNAQLIKIKGP